MFVKGVDIQEKYISFGIPYQTTYPDGTKAVAWFNFIAVGVAKGKLEERGIKSGDKVDIKTCYPKILLNGKIQWVITDIN